MTVTSDPSFGSVLDPASDPVPVDVRVLDAGALLDEVVAHRQAAEQCEARVLLLAVHYVDLHPVTEQHLAASPSAGERWLVDQEPPSTDERGSTLAGRHAGGGGVCGGGAGRGDRRSLRDCLRLGRGQCGVVLPVAAVVDAGARRPGAGVASRMVARETTGLSRAARRVRRGQGTFACLCGRHHRLRTFTAWRYELQDDGRFTWTSPRGQQLTTHAVGQHVSLRPAAPRTTPGSA